MRVMVFSSVLFVLLLGCSHPHYIASIDSDERQSLEQLASKGSCAVVLVDGTKYKAANLTIGPDSTTWVSKETGERVGVATSDIEKIVFVSRGRGAAEGVLVGFAAGASLGAFLGLLSGEDCEEVSGEICISRQAAVMIGIVALGLPVALVGAMVGASHGSKDLYYPFPKDSTAAVGDSVSLQRGEGGGPPD
ncbi:MAG: hypothetical protein JSW58_02540 [Candidatus Latescibacterota bacterium]|nr:MAG: hypothetical protein JSW58_02540 [Candidatus Latescibacterota bacterium]